MTYSKRWFEPLSVAEDGIVVGRNKAFGIGTLLVLRCSTTKRILMGRKSFRVGFEGSNQFTFPGGMLRSTGVLDFDACLEHTLYERVIAETGISIRAIDNLVSLDDWPPIVGRYTIRGDQLVSSLILPFLGYVNDELQVSAQDPSVYSVAWYNPLEIMPEVTQTNALILAQILWSEWSKSQQEKVKAIVLPQFESVRANAEIVGAALPQSPWGD